MSLPSRREQGSVSVFAVIAVTILVMFVGVAVDLSGMVHTLERAQDVARQAARAAAQAADAPTAIRGEGAAVDAALAAQAGRAYLGAAGLDGGVAVTGDTVTVTATASYSPVILGLIGIGGAVSRAQPGAPRKRCAPPHLYTHVFRAPDSGCHYRLTSRTGPRGIVQQEWHHDRPVPPLPDEPLRGDLQPTLGAQL